MTIQTINLGNYANDGTGDDLRTAFQKVNANFALLETDVTGGVNLGAGTGIFADKNSTNLEFKSLTSTGNSVTITHTSTTVNLEATPSLVNDPNPQLGSDLNLESHRIYNGDAETTVYGYDVPALAGIIQLLTETNQINLDFNGGLGDLDGFSETPTTATIDFNGTGNINFLDSADNKTNLDLGRF
jgi:hypothetical protein